MGDTRYWSTTLTIIFLEKYREFPCLKKIKSKDHLHKNLKTDLVESVTKNSGFKSGHDNHIFMVVVGLMIGLY